MYKVKFKKLSDDAVLPCVAYEGDAGLDLFSIDNVVIKPGERALIHTGIAIELPPDTEAQIRPRSGYALKNGVTVLNSPGTIDQGYRNEIGIILINHGKENFIINKGMKVAQLVIKPTYRIVFEETTNFSGSDRGEQGFGSTGTN
ncbi:MAG: dUTP diphosphatase [Nitrososphaerota archaeon]|nr:dUTP diphosphatase [Nitrososphaerota archaeon]